MSAEASQNSSNDVEISENEGNLQITFNDRRDFSLFLRKIAIHKHQPLDENVLDDVMDCDWTFYAVASAFEAYATNNPLSEEKKIVTANGEEISLAFDGTATISSDSYVFKLIVEKLRKKIENGPCMEKVERASDHRLLLKKFFAPYLITDEQADNIVKELEMRTDCLYGRLR